VGFKMDSHGCPSIEKGDPWRDITSFSINLFRAYQFSRICGSSFRLRLTKEEA
jgi:hypothetical protein